MEAMRLLCQLREKSCTYEHTLPNRGHTTVMNNNGSEHSAETGAWCCSIWLVVLKLR
jgi:hypothetical protein